ncbi:MAG: hypothetical protein RLZZ283_401 [Candidatus Parcubacteria bacterium]|jgi:hypothetical protein
MWYMEENTHTTSNQTFVIVAVLVVLLVIAGVSFFMWRPAAGTKAPVAIDTTGGTASGDYKLEILPTGEVVPRPVLIDGKGDVSVDVSYPDEGAPTMRRILIPSLTREIAFIGTVSAEQKTNLIARMNAVVATLTQDKSNGAYWFERATIFLEAGDYEAAHEVWQFLNDALPASNLAATNLGKMYMYQKKDYQKAESYLLSAITRNPLDFTPYQELYVLYTSGFKTGTTAAANILITAEKSIDTYQPSLLLGQYYVQMGDKASAEAAFGRALVRARAGGDTTAISIVEQEITRLKAQ